MLSESMQDYLKTIYQISPGTNRVTTNSLADMLGVTAASVTGMLKKLADMKLVEYEPYQGVVLTLAGKKLALEVLRHHRLTELYLTEAMGYSWDQVHEEAERLEHAISAEFADKMSSLLGDPQRDPHGSPIPSKDGEVATTSQLTLNRVPEGHTVTIERVTDESSETLRALAALGLMPGVTVTLAGYDVQDNTVRISVNTPDANGNATHTETVQADLARYVYVVEK
jgi:DtxR family Mn-dependent transcriptional regulator